MRYLLTAVAFLLTLALVAAIAFVAVLLLAGPHSDTPQWLEVVVFILGWGAVLGVPGYVAGKVWRRMRPAP